MRNKCSKVIWWDSQDSWVLELCVSKTSSFQHITITIFIVFLLILITPWSRLQAPTYPGVRATEAKIFGATKITPPKFSPNLSERMHFPVIPDQLKKPKGWLEPVNGLLGFFLKLFYILNPFSGQFMNRSLSFCSFPVVNDIQVSRGWPGTMWIGHQDSLPERVCILR